MSDIKLYNADCLDILKTLDANSIDSIVCDPPYGLSFMGKDWDHGVPGVAFWEAALRVAKPGAMLLAFGGTRTFHRLTVAIEDAGWEIRDCLTWLYGSGFPKSHNLGNGWGTALKPAWEPIIMAMKPLDGTYANNALVHGVAGINVDASRIGTTQDDLAAMDRHKNPTRTGWVSASPDSAYAPNIQGRWPANLLLDEEAASQLGDVSRYFYIAKASKRDRDEGLEGMEERECGMMEDDNYPIKTGSGNLRQTTRRNHHPTVKPTQLMRYLCRMVTPPNGVILDPFAGSGSTGKAAVLEGFSFVGIELEAEYLAIAERRIAHAQAQVETPTQAQPTLLEVGS